MPFDFDQTLQDMLGVVTAQGGKGAKKAKELVKTFAEQNRHRMELTIQAYQNGELTEADLAMYLRQNKDILEMQFNTLKIVGKAAVQSIVNGVLTILEKVLRAAV